MEGCGSASRSTRTYSTPCRSSSGIESKISRARRRNCLRSKDWPHTETQRHGENCRAGSLRGRAPTCNGASDDEDGVVRVRAAAGGEVPGAHGGVRLRGGGGGAGGA